MFGQEEEPGGALAVVVLLVGSLVFGALLTALIGLIVYGAAYFSQRSKTDSVSTSKAEKSSNVSSLAAQFCNSMSRFSEDGGVDSALQGAIAQLVQNGKVDRLVDMTNCTSTLYLEATKDKPSDEDSLRSGVYQVVFVELTTTGTVDLQELERDLNDKLHLCLTAIHSGHERHLRKAPYPDVKVFLVKPAAFIRLRNYMLTDAGASPSELKESKGLLQNSLDLIRFMASERI